MDEEHLTERQVSSRHKAALAKQAYRNAGKGERILTSRRLNLAAIEVLKADVEAGHMALKEDNREGVRR